jgi:hypothetical protein
LSIVIRAKAGNTVAPKHRAQLENESNGVEQIMKLISALALAALLLLSRQAAAQVRFETSVSTDYQAPGLYLFQTRSPMNTVYFVERPSRTVYSDEVVAGVVQQGDGSIFAHATWVIRYNSNTRTVNLNRNKTHITSRYGNQRCHVYENQPPTCTCNGGRVWNICSNPDMAGYVAAMSAAAATASFNAKTALEQDGYRVTRYQ